MASDISAFDQWNSLKETKTKKGIFALCNKPGFKLEARDENDRTPLLVKLSWNEFDCVMALLIMEANIDAKDKDGDGVLHYAAMTDNIDLLKLVIVFGADVKATNNRNETPLLVADRLNKPNKSAVMYFLHRAEGCIPGDTTRPRVEVAEYTIDVYTGSDRFAGTDMSIYITLHAADGKENSGRCLLDNPDKKGFERSHKHTFKIITKDLGDISQIDLQMEKSGYFNFGSAWQVDTIMISSNHSDRVCVFPGFRWIDTDDKPITIQRGTDRDHFLLPPETKKTFSGDRILSLDGGGIRGLILIQILLEIEKHLGKDKDGKQMRIKDCFDWIGGTSTGGILALAIVHDKTIRTCQSIYFQMKDDIFGQKNKPYDDKILAQFLQKIFGQNTTMIEKEPSSSPGRHIPKVIVTSVMANRVPGALHLFRNYQSGAAKDDETDRGNFPAPENPKEQLVWEACRSTGAAPYYFKPSGIYIDGGMMANNPTLDILTEIDEYGRSKTIKNAKEEPKPIDVVVSLGTGRPIVRPSKVPSVWKPNFLNFIGIKSDVLNGITLGKLLMHQATQSEGQIVHRSVAWCNMIKSSYFRFNPPVKEDIELDCTDDITLVDMLWGTRCYLQRHEKQIQALAEILRRTDPTPAA